MIASSELKQAFTDYFVDLNHSLVPPASLIPENDPSVLFTTAGMQQFKRFYTNPDLSPNPRVVTIQPCIRTSDIDEVGDSSHLTYFEMLGNFSFGYPSKTSSYFKDVAIVMAWEFLTNVLKIDASRIHATYFKGDKGIPEDGESLEILNRIKNLKEINSQGIEDNFWSLGTEGSPGGPTVEFYVDGLEVWNLVFNEYIIKNGKYVPSEHKGVDTGMGFERLLAILSNKSDIYETDIFAKRADEIERFSLDKSAKRILLDHCRAIENLIKSGVIPSNKDTGYILRRLIRRIVLIVNKYHIPLIKIINIPEVTIESEKFNQNLKNFNIQNHIKGKAELTAKELFDFYQTNGIPLELSLELAKENNIKIENGAVDGFKQLLKSHQEKSTTASSGMFKGGLASGGEMETKYHTATHLLLAALRQTLGEEIYQKGSNITSQRLRFDFNFPEKLSNEQIRAIEKIVNEKIEDNIPVTMVEMPKAEALKHVKISFDPSKYTEVVKVYSIGDFSSELCGGPHVNKTGEIGKFKIVKEESISAGIRRIKAVVE